MLSNAQLDVVHWLPPLVTDAEGASASNLNTQRLIISTPSTNAVNYSVVDGAGITVSSGTVSNSSPIDIVLGQLVSGDYTSQTPGAGNIIDYSQFNTISTEGLTIIADEPIYVNVRQRSGAQGASLTGKGCSGMGTEFRVGVKRERENFGTEAYRNHFVSVMATEDDTVITFDDFKPGVVISGGTATTEPPASGTPLTTDPISVTLDAGESYAIGIHMAFYRGDGATASINDLNGTRITADKPVVTSSGTFLGSPTSSGARDAGFDQIASTARAGTEYIVIIGGGNPDNDIESPMVVAAEDGTNVYVNGSATPINTTPLNAGDYLYINDEWNTDGILYVETSEPAMMYATTGGSNSSATSGFSFIPPLDPTVANSVDSIYNVNQIGPAVLRAVTTAGSTVTFNGNPPANGPLAVTGNPDWVVYTQAGVTGDVSVQSTGPVAVSIMNLQNPVGAQGYFSGFPELKPNILAEGLGCLPGAKLTAIDPSGGLLRLLEWFQEDGTPTGVTGDTFYPTAPGRYFVRGSISATAPCPTADSQLIEVLPCPESDVTIVKTVSPELADVGDTVTFSITAINLGPDDAPTVEITDIVPSGYTYVPSSISGGDTQLDTDPTGVGLQWVINSLPSAVGSEQQTVTFDAVVQASGSYDNTATITTLALNDDPANNSDSVAVEIAVPGVEVTKSLSGLTPNGGGSFTATYLIEVENTGNEPLESVQITDGINQAPNTFPAGSTVAITNVSGLTINSSYNGTSNTNLLDGSDTLAVSATASVEIEVNFTIDGSQPYQNQAVLSTQGAVSDDVVIEPSDNPDTTLDDDPTPVNPSAVPEIDVNKGLDDVIDNGDGTFTASFTIRVSNTGDEPLINLSLDDPLGAPSTFPAGSSVIVTGNTNLTINGGYDGTSQTELLDGTDRLAPGQSGEVKLDVTFTPTSDGPYENIVIAEGDGEFSGDDTASRASAEVFPPLDPAMEIDKKLDSLTLDGSTSLFTATFTATVTNTGNEAITSIVLEDDLDSAPNNFPSGSVGAVSGATGGLNANLSYDGVSNLDLLAGTNTLAVGASGTVTYTVTFAKDVNSPYLNQIQGKTEGALSGDTDGESSNDPDTAIDDDPTLVDPEFDPQVSLTKVVDNIVDNGDGTFTVNFTITVNSIGNEPLVNIQITDSLTTGFSTFPAGSSALVTGTNNLTENPTYNGISDTQVLDGTDRLSGASSGSVSIAATFTPDGVGPFANSASIAADGEFSGIPVSDAVTPGVPFSPPLDSEVEVTKTISSVIDNGNGTFTANFLFVVSNAGNEPLVNVQVTDNLYLAPSSFPTGSIVTVGAVTGGLSVNGAFDGDTTTSLLSGSDTLGVGDSGTVAVAVQFTPDGDQPYFNQATANAIGQFTNNPDNDLSDDPVTAVADDPTQVDPPLDPEIAILKSLDGVVDNGDGSYTGTFTITVENTGNEPLINVQISDSPQLPPSTLPSGTTSSLVGTSAGLTGNTLFNGTTDGTLLSGTDTLGIGQIETIQVALTFTPDGNEPYLNQATGRGTGQASGDPAGAKSDDPGTPAVDDGTAVGPVYVTEIEVTKTLDTLTDNGDGSFTAIFDIGVSNTGSESLLGVQIVEDLDLAPSNFPAGSTASIVSTSSLVANTSFDGVSDTNLLAGTDTLLPSGSASLKVQVDFTPTSANPYLNQVTASGQGENSGQNTNNGSGSPVNVIPNLTPSLSVTKNLDIINDNGDGTFQAVFTISVVNDGNEPLVDVQVTDALNAVPNGFPSSAVAAVIGTTGGLTQASPAYTGSGQPNLLVGTDTLAPGQGGTITITVGFAGVAGVSEFCNQASGGANGEFTNTAVTILSDDPDTAAIGDPTKSNPPFVPSLTLEKSVTNVTDNGDGTFTAAYTINVTNTGNEVVTNVQVIDPISTGASTFPAGSTATIVLSSGVTVASPAYNGVTQTNLLAGTDSLAVNASGTVNVEVIFTPDGAQPYANQATATGVGQSSGDSESDVSDDPTTATPNDATKADPALLPSIGLTKEVTNIIDNFDGSFTAEYTLTIGNEGNEPLSNLQLVDAITVSPNDFPSGSTVAITGTTGGLTSNGSFDGIADVNLLDGNDTLAFGASGTVDLELTFTPDGSQPYTNQANVTGDGTYSGDPANAISDDPATGAADDGTVTTPPIVPEISLTKELQNLVDNGDGTFTATFDIIAMNDGNEPLINLSVVDAISVAPSDFPSGSTAVITGTGPGIVANTGFDGVSDTEMVASGQSIPVGGERRLTVDVTFTPTSTGSYQNQATTSADGSASAVATNATSDDPAGSNTPDEPTVVDFTLTPELTTTKTFNGVVDNGDGSFTANYTVTLLNSGNEALVKLQATDELSATPNTFPAGAVGAVTMLSGGLTVATPAYDGQTNINLLAGTDTLAVGVSETVQFSVTFTPTSGSSYPNTVDGNSDGALTNTNAPDQGVASSFTPTFLPSINVSKTLDGVSHVGGGIFEALFTIGVTNAGNEPLSVIQLVDDILSAPSNFPAGSTASIVGTTSLSSNAGYDGVTNTNLLTGGDTLPVGGNGSVEVKVSFTPDGTQPYTNEVNAVASGSYSTNATAADGQADVTPTLTPGIEVTKTLDNLLDNTDGTFTAQFTLDVTNTGNELLNSVQAVDAIIVAPNDFPAGSTAVITGTSFGLSPNTSYDGIGDTNLLTGTDSLAVGVTESVSLDVTFTPGSDTTYSNTASASGAGNASGDNTNDDSNTVVVDPDIIPTLELTKSLDSLVSLPGGVFRSTFTIEVQNTGNEPLTGIQVTDDLDSTPSNFPAGTVGSVIGTTGGLTPATTVYDGDTQINMLEGTDILAAGAVGTITVQVDFSVLAGDVSYVNQAIGSGTGSLTGGSVTEPSDDPDTSVIDDDPTPSTPEFLSEMEVEKALDSVVHVANGVFKATYTITVTNTGNEVLQNIQVDDPILTGGSTFPVGSTATITGTTNLVQDMSYNGFGTTTMLVGTDSFAPNEFGTITVEVTFTPDGTQPYENQAIGSGVGGSSSQPESDLSDDPATSDDPSDPTLTAPVITNGIEVAKTIGTIVDNNDGTFTAPYTIVVTQVGNEPLNNVSVMDSLSVFPTGASAVVSNPGGSWTLNGAYDGTVDAELLAAGNTLAVGGTETVLMDVTFTPDGSQPYVNSAQVSGDGAYTGDSVNDSDDALAANPPLNPVVELTKVLDDIVDNGDGTFTANFIVTVTNNGNEPIIAVQVTDSILTTPSTFPVGSTATVTNTTGLTENTSYDGVTNSSVLSGTDMLAINASGTAEIAVIFTPDGNQPYTNSATANADGDHSGDSTTSTGAAPVNPPLNPVLEVAKALDVVADIGGGSFTATYTISATNTGNEPLDMIQLVDSVSTFPTGATASILGTTGGWSPNSSYDGVSDTNLLTGVDTLALGQTETVTVQVTFTPTSNAAYPNTVSGAAEGAYSDNSTTDSATAVDAVPPFDPTLSVEKTLSGVVDAGGGQFTATYVIELENTSNEPLVNVQIIDALTTAPNNYPAGTVGVITGSTSFTTNTGYNGGADTNLLATGNTLAVGATGSVTVEVTFTPDGTQPYNNTAVGSADGAYTAINTTDSGAAPVADPPFVPALSVEKTLSGVVDAGGGQFVATYVVELENTGNEPLVNVQAVDALLVSPNNYPAGTVGAITGATSFTTNTGYNGGTDTNLLATGNTLAVGATGDVTIEVTFTPDGTQPYLNRADGSANGEYTTDSATGNGTAPTVNPTLTPSLAMTKTLDLLTDNGDGTFTAQFTLEVRNTGNERINGVQVVDAIDVAPNTFPSSSVAMITGSSTGFTTSMAFDGITNVNLLTGTDSMAVGAIETVSLSVTFTPDSNDDYLNQASVSGTGDASTNNISDTSDDPGSTALDDPTAVNPVLTPALSVEKTLSGVVDAGGGQFVATYVVELENTGNEPLVNVQAVDALLVSPNNYPAGTVGAITGATSFTTNTGYNGGTDTNLLATGNTLAVGATGDVTIEVTFTPDGTQPYLNRADGSANGEYTTDSATGNDDALAADPPFVPALSVEKTLSGVVDAGGGQFVATYVVELENTGNEPLVNVQAVDALLVSPNNYPAGTVGAITGATSFTTNTGYNGGADTNLLATGNTLAVGATGDVTIEVTFTPDGTQPYLNRADGSANGEYTTGSVTNGSTALVASPTLTPGIEVTKTLDNLLDNTDGTFTAQFTLDVTNTGNELLNSVQAVDAIIVAPNDFPAGSTAVITGTSFGLSPNTSYDGIGDTNLLTGTDSLAVGVTESVSLDVTFTPGSDTTYSNTASASGAGNASGDNTNDDSNTVVVDPDIIPTLELTKSLDSLVSLPGGVFRSTFTIEVQNTGNEPLTGIQVTDDLDSTPSNFPAGTVGSVIGTTGGLTPATTVYDGDTQINMLEGTDILAAGAVGTITVQVDFSVLAGDVSYVNQAIGSGTGSLTGGSVTEPSDDPDTSVIDDDPTPSTPEFLSEMEVEKALDSVVHVANGVFKATYTITVTNTGNEVLQNIQVDDPILTGGSTFPVGSTATITGTTNLVQDMSYNGFGTTTMLVGTDSFAPNEFGTITVEVTFTPDGTQPYENQAIGSGVGGSSSQPESDLSDDPATSDDPSDPTLTAPVITNGIEVAKTIGTIVDNNDGTFTAPYTIVVTQVGNEPLNNVSVMDSLSVFPTGASAVVSNPGGSWTLNGAYDGTVDAELLAAGNTLAVGGTETVLMDVTFTPDGSQPYVNSAQVSGDGAYTGDSVNDSDDALAANPPLNPVVELTKVLDDIVDNGDGTFTAQFTLEVRNTGNERINGVQIVDAIDVAPNTFPSSSVAMITGSSTGFTTSMAFDGITNVNLLTGTDSMAVGAIETVSLSVTFTPDSNDDYLNQASVSGTGDASTNNISDTSDDPGSTALDDPTAVNPVLTPALSVEKTLSGVVDAGGGQFVATYVVELENTGNEPLVNVQAVDALLVSPNNYPAGTVGAITGATSFTTNTGYNGGTDTNLLATGNTLAVGATGDVTIEVTFTPDGTQPYLNRADGSANGEYTTDSATGNGTAPTVNPTLTPSLAMTKTLDLLTDNGDGTFTAQFTLEVRNTGNERINGVQVVDAIDVAPNTFPSSSVAMITGSSTGFTTSMAFDGITNVNLLTGTDSMAVGAIETVSLSVTFTPDSNDDYLNQASVSGTGDASTNNISDTSDDPGSTALDDPTAVNPVLTPALSVEKTLSGVVDAGGGQFVATYVVELENTGNEPLVNVQAVDALLVSPNNYPAGTVGAITGATSFTTNTGYNGGTDTNLLATGNTLAVGATGDVTIEVTFTPDGTQPYLNRADGSANGEYTTDSATGNGTAPTVNPTLTPSLAMTKTLDLLTDNGDGTFTSAFTLEVMNTGNERINGVQIVDAIDVAPNNFPTGSIAVITGSSTGFVINNFFDGVSDTNLLAGTDSIGVDDVETVSLEVTFTPDSNDDYLNQASVSGIGNASGDSTSDISDDPSTLPLEDSTIIDPILIPEIDVEKELVDVVDNGSGSFTSTYRISVTNVGNEVLSDVQASDTISDYPSTSVVTLSNPTGGLSPNTSYDGFTSTDLFASNMTLAVGASGSIDLAVTFDVDAQSYTNNAFAVGRGVLSNEIDTDLDFAPAAIPTLESELGLTKTLVSTVSNTDLTNTSVFKVAVENTGNEDLNSVQITDAVGSAPSDFPSGFTAVITSVTSGYTANGSYDGNGSDTLLSAPVTLGAGELIEVLVAVTYLQDGSSTYVNSASVVGIPAISGGFLDSDDSAQAIPGQIKPDTYSAWQNANPLGGQNAPLDNPDGDVSPNLAEYAFCLDPDSGLWVFPDGETPNCGLALTLNPVTGKIDASYQRPPNTNLTYELLHSTDGVNWNSAGVVPTSTTTSSFGADRVTYADVETLLGPECLLIVQATLVDADGTHTANSEIVGWQPHTYEEQCETFASPFVDNCFFSGSGVVDTGAGTLDLTQSLGGEALTSALDPNAQYAIEILEGPHCGHRFDIASYTADTVTLAQDTDLCAPDPCNTSLTIPDFSNSTVVILPYPTLDDLFPPSMHLAGTNNSSADNVMFFNRNTQSMETFYLLDDPSGDKWVPIGSTVDAGTMGVCPTEGLFTHRRGDAFTTTQFGGVRDWKVTTPLKQGYNLVAPAHPIDESPADRLMLTSGFTGSGDPATADQFLLWNGDASVGLTGYDGYFYTKALALDQWTSVGDVGLVDQTAIEHFESDRSAFYCIRDAAGLPNYQIPSTVIPPAELTQP